MRRKIMVNISSKEKISFRLVMIAMFYNAVQTVLNYHPAIYVGRV